MSDVKDLIAQGDAYRKIAQAHLAEGAKNTNPNLRPALRERIIDAVAFATMYYAAAQAHMLLSREQVP